LISFRENRRLSLYEECAGQFRGLFFQNDGLIALIGKIHLALPLDVEDSLKPLIGQRITILRTDLPEKPYLFRLLDLEPTP
jgi:hypothetical protein